MLATDLSPAFKKATQTPAMLEELVIMNKWEEIGTNLETQIC